MSVHINGLAYRITQTLIIVIGLALLWLYQYTNRPQPEFHRVNFGVHAQLVSVIPSPELVARGDTVEFSIRWWLLDPLPSDQTISYRIRNRQIDLAFLDTNKIQATGQPYADISNGGLIFDDHIALAIPDNATPGIYEVVAYLYPFAGNELNNSLGSPIYSPQRTLFTVNITR